MPDATDRVDVSLSEAITFMRDEMESWAQYAGNYFIEKHDLAGDLAEMDALAQHAADMERELDTLREGMAPIPAESIAMTVARAMVDRGEGLPPNIAFAVMEYATRIRALSEGGAG